jgi:hypothetical protein
MGQSGPVRLVTGNRLRDGVPVYYAGPGRWSPAIADARLLAEDAAAAALAAVEADPLPRPVVAPYLIDAEIKSDRIRPASLRERIRAFGPTV